jgi:hypothetical protein
VCTFRAFCVHRGFVVKNAPVNGVTKTAQCAHCVHICVPVCTLGDTPATHMLEPCNRLQAALRKKLENVCFACRENTCAQLCANSCFRGFRGPPISPGRQKCTRFRTPFRTTVCARVCTRVHTRHTARAVFRAFLTVFGLLGDFYGKNTKFAKSAQVAQKCAFFVFFRVFRDFEIRICTCKQLCTQNAQVCTQCAKSVQKCAHFHILGTSNLRTISHFVTPAQR